MHKKIYFPIFIVISLFTLISCGNKKAQNKKTPQENEFTKVQKLYDKKGFERFCKYVEKNNYIPVKDKSFNDATPLLITIKNGDLEKAKLFITKGASLEENDSENHNSIDYALETSDNEIIAFVIKQMPINYWNIPDKEGNLPLIKFFIHNVDYNILKYCLDSTNEINYINPNNKSLLMFASQMSFDVRTVKYLLDKGARINDKNNNEWNAIMYAARYNPNPAVLEDLILRGANTEPNSVGLTITMLAACNPNPGILLTLLKYKNEINAVTNQGKTALMYACENNQPASIIKLLIDNGADLNAKDFEDKTVRDYMSSNSSLSISDIASAWSTAESNLNENVSDINTILESSDENTEKNITTVSENENSENNNESTSED